MIDKKNIKLHGKLSLSTYFQEFKDGEKVAIIREHSLMPKFPSRIQGKTGIISGMKGSAYIVKLMDGNQEKTFVITPAHLKKIKVSQ
jgi:large subunit ribosomal protein L21e